MRYKIFSFIVIFFLANVVLAAESDKSMFVTDIQTLLKDYAKANYFGKESDIEMLVDDKFISIDMYSGVHDKEHLLFQLEPRKNSGEVVVTYSDILVKDIKFNSNYRLALVDAIWILRGKNVEMGRDFENKIETTFVVGFKYIKHGEVIKKWRIITQIDNLSFRETE